MTAFIAACDLLDSSTVMTIIDGEFYELRRSRQDDLLRFERRGARFRANLRRFAQHGVAELRCGIGETARSRKSNAEVGVDPPRPRFRNDGRPYAYNRDAKGLCAE